MRRACAATTLLVCLTAFVSAVTFPYNHDEEQYVAAAFLAPSHRLYADFVYLQTPLYPLLMSVARLAPAEHTYLVIRLLSAAIFALSCLCAFGIGARVTGEFRLGIAAALLMSLSPLLQTEAGSARNDALPCLLMLAGLYAGVAAITDRRGTTDLRWRWFICGLSLSLAVSAKLSYAFAPLAALGYVILRARANTLPYCAGGALGALPVLYYLIMAPRNFRFDVLLFHLTGPSAWYARNDLGFMSGWPYRFALLGKMLGAEWGVLAALCCVAWFCVAGHFSEASARARLFLILVLACAVPASFMITPFHEQYVIPVFALALVAGASCAPIALKASSVGKMAIALLCICLAPGIEKLARASVQAMQPSLWVPEAQRQEALQIRAALAPRKNACVATLSPISVLEAGETIYPQLASGPFLFRSAGILSPGQLTALPAISPSTLAALLDAHRPTAIFVAHEGDWKIPLDQLFAAYAVAHRYARLVIGTHGAKLFVAPSDLKVSTSCAWASP